MSAATTGPQQPDLTIAQIARASERRLLSAAEEQALGRLMRQGDQDARDLMVLRNDRLVWDIAFRHKGRGMEVEDLHSHGVLGLLRALQDWDPERGLKFSTYAHAWIRQAITRALADYSRPIRLPVHMGHRLQQIARATADLLVELGRSPTDPELCKRVGLSQAQLDAARVAERRADPMRLDAPAHQQDADSDELHMFIADPTADDPQEQLEAYAEASLRAALVGELLTNIPRRLAKVLRLRYGLDNHGGNRTLEQVGRVLGLTRERVRQLEADALDEIRQVAAARQLAPAAD